jgi:mRNA interferase RelE/StbE
MAVKFRKQAIKFLQKANPEDVARIQGQLSELITAIEEQGVIPFNALDIKKMKGEWEGFYRLRVGNIRVVFTVIIDSATADVEIYTIGARGDVYK